MTYGARLNIALGVGLAAMLLVAWLMQRDEASLQPKVADLDPASVQTLRIEMRGREPLVFEREADGWRMRIPFELDADPRRIDEVITGLNTPSQQRYPVGSVDAPALGLGADPVGRVVVDGEPFALGGVNPVGGLRYVQHGEVVHLAFDVLHFRLLGDPHTWALRQPLKPGARIARIETRRFTLTREGEESWALDPPDESVAHETLQQVVDAWANAQAYQVIPFEGTTTDTDEVRVWMDGNENPLVFHLRRTDEAMVLIREDLALAYRLPLYGAGRLDSLD